MTEISATRPSWRDFEARLWTSSSLGVRLDVSRMGLSDADWASLGSPLARAIDEMDALEGGAIANADEDRRVGHYWLRDPDRAPDAATAGEIRDAVASVLRFAADVHSGAKRPSRGGRFENLLLVGIGGSALGPQLLADALADADAAMRFWCLDNTDPDGIDRTLGEIGGGLDRTLVVVTSKSGGTKETRNAMLETRRAFVERGLSFPESAAAITQPRSALDDLARDDGWLERLPLWDWVGGRTSMFSPVGLLPAALLGLSVDALLDGARAMDRETRLVDPRRNPAALMAASWFHAGGGRGDRHMVVLPYRDRLSLLARYLQQLVMESLGKERDRSGNTVHQGLTVFGNKGSTDQHAFVQQLREGRDDFFASFVQVLEDREARSMEVEDAVTSGDMLTGFLLGTRDALTEKGRPSTLLTLERLDERSLGALVALHERVVGLYASLVDVNAYHQPGVEAGKRAAARAMDVQRRALEHLRGLAGRGTTAEAVADALGMSGEAETIYHLLEHAAANPDHGVSREKGPRPTAALYRVDASGEGS